MKTQEEISLQHDKGLHVGFKSWHNSPDKTIKPSFSFLSCKIGMTPTSPDWVRIDKMYLKRLARSRQSMNDNYYYHYYYFLKIIEGCLGSWENLYTS